MEMRKPAIVLGVADVRREDPHLRPAIAFAAARGATLHVVHGFHLPDPTFYPYPEISALSPEALRQLQEGVQEALEQQVRTLGSSTAVHCRAVPGPPELAIASVAREVEADLILVGATRRGKLGRTVLGTTAQRVVRSAPVPVLVSHEAAPRLARRVLLPTDLSDLSAGASRRGIGLVRRYGSVNVPELRFLLVLGYDLTLPPPLSHEALHAAAAAELRKFVGRLGFGGDAPEIVRTGDAAEQIVAEAEAWDADLVVLGTHGRTGLPRLLIGSVAESVLRRARCDVLVVPTPAVTVTGAVDAGSVALEEVTPLP